MPAPDAPPPAATPPPPSWLQALLANHVAVLALGGALGGAVLPVWQEVVAWRKGVASSELALMRESDALWKRNLACVAQSSSWEVDGPRGLTVRLTVCEGTGDILARYFNNDWNPNYKWLRAPETGEKP